MLEGIVDYLLLTLQVLNLAILVYLFYSLFTLYKRRKGKSMEHFYYLALLGFVLIFAVTLTDLLSVLPAFRWDIVRAFSTLILIITFMYMLKYLNRTIEGYEEAIRIKTGEKSILKGMK